MIGGKSKADGDSLQADGEVGQWAGKVEQKKYDQTTAVHIIQKLVSAHRKTASEKERHKSQKGEGSGQLLLLFTTTSKHADHIKRQGLDKISEGFMRYPGGVGQTDGKGCEGNVFPARSAFGKGESIAPSRPLP